MKNITKKSIVSLAIAIVMMLNIIPFQALATTQYTVTFDLAGGTMEGELTQTVNEGESPILSEEPTKGYMKVYHWTDSDNKVIYHLEDYQVTKDTTLTAHWVTWFGVYTENNGKVGTSYDKDVEPTSYNTGFGGISDEGEIGYYWAKPNDGYIFKEWVNRDDGTFYSSENPIMLKSGETKGFYVRATYDVDPNPKYTVTFNSKNGSEVPSQKIYSGEKAVKPADPTRDGYAFENWYLDSKYTEVFDFDTPITEPITLYAKWTPTTATTYTVIFDTKGGSDIPDQLVYDGESPVLSEEPTKGYMKLYNWTDSEGNVIYHLEDYQVTKNTTLTAHWVTWFGVYTENNGQVGTSHEKDVEPTSYNNGFGGISDEGELSYYWAKPKEGYIFKEWVNNDDGTFYSTENPLMLKSGETKGFYVKATYLKIHEHPLTLVPKKAATLSENGTTTEYYKCSECDKVFKDEYGTEEISLEDITISQIAEIKLSKTSYTYNGKVQKPTITVKDSLGNVVDKSNYTVKYPSGCKNVGEYTVTVTFKGNYSGSKKLTYKIVPKETTLSKVKAGKKSFTATWKKQATQTTGYELMYSTSKTFKSGNKTVKITKNKTTSKKVSKLKAKKKYYVKVRTYKTVNGNKIYSSWSKVKTVTTKK